MSHTIRILNGRVWTGDPARPRADAVAIRDDRIVAIGTADDVRRAVPDAEDLDARGGLVVPGFIDAHLHLLAGGFRLTSVQLRGVTSRDAFTPGCSASSDTIVAPAALARSQCSWTSSTTTNIRLVASAPSRIAIVPKPSVPGPTITYPS